jgi:hypothetical protein
MEARALTRMIMVSKTSGSYDTCHVSDFIGISTEGKTRQSMFADVLACAPTTKVQWRVEEASLSPPGSSEKP